MGRNEHILQCQHESKENILPSICLHVFLILAVITQNCIYTAEIIFRTCVNDGHSVLATSLKKIYHTFKTFLVEFHENQWPNKDMCKRNICCKCRCELNNT